MTSLYDRLGGVYSIATVIDDFIDRIMVDPRLNANPKVDEAHHRVPPASRHGDGLLGHRGEASSITDQAADGSKFATIIDRQQRITIVSVDANF